jgi:HEAT repeat protein
MRHSDWISRVLLSVTSLTGLNLFAQDAFLTNWEERVRRQPQGVTFSIAAPKSEFFFGEVIPLQLKFTATEPRAFLADSRLQDRVGRMNYVEEFFVDQAALAADPLQGLPGGQGGMGGLSGGPVILSEKPFDFERVLNEWIRFRQPGEYRIYVISRRVRQVEEPGHSDYYLHLHERGKAIDLASNVLTLKILPAPPLWVKQQIADAKNVLDEASKPDSKTQQERAAAIRVLRFLDSPEAAKELLLRLNDGHDVDSFSAYMGVLGSPYRKQLLPLMEQRLLAPDQPVWDRYLDALAQLTELVNSGGPMPPYPKDPAAQKEWQEESTRRATSVEQRRSQYATQLIASLPAKRAEARAVSLNTLLEMGTRNSAKAPWLPNVVASLMAEFRSLPVMTQSMLLEYRWNMLKGPAILPLLRDLLANPPQQPFDPSIQATALRRLYELSPVEGRKIILEEIRDSTRNLPFSTLAMLPDPALPELDDALAKRFDPLLILRYATGDIVKRVETLYAARQTEIERRNLPTCAGPLAFYFLKFDPPFGERLLRADFTKSGLAPVCYDVGFQFLQFGRWAYSPALERLAIESLADPKVPVKRGAAEVLGKYGTAAAEKPLWDAMEYFHSWWRGHEKELNEKAGEESVQLERALQISLAQGDGWVLQETDLKRLLSLCSTEWCRTEVTAWVNTAKQPVSVGIMLQIGGFNYTVNQYGPGDEDWLKRKLSEYSYSTSVKVVTWANEGQVPGLRGARERAQAIVQTVGQVLVQ